MRLQNPFSPDIFRSHSPLSTLLFPFVTLSRSISLCPPFDCLKRTCSPSNRMVIRVAEWIPRESSSELMDNNNWRPTHQVGEPAMEAGDWRAHLAPDSRQKIVNKIMETLKRHLPFSGPEGINELRRIAARFEEKIFTSATHQTDYLRKISMKMLTMETESQNNAAGSPTAISAANNSTPLESELMDDNNWRAQLTPDARQISVDKLTETLKKHLPLSGPEGINELTRIAATFEEKIFTSATCQITIAK